MGMQRAPEPTVFIVVRKCTIDHITSRIAEISETERRLCLHHEFVRFLCEQAERAGETSIEETLRRMF